MRATDELDSLMRSGYPFVIVDPLEPLRGGVRAVAANNALGGRAATEHLLSLGHTRIGVVTGVPDWLGCRELRRRGALGRREDPGLAATPARCSG